MRVSVRRTLFALAVLATVSAGVGPLAPAGDGPVGTAAAADGEIAPDDVVVRIDVRANGTAVWQVEYRYLLTTDDRTRGFERLRDAVDGNRSAYVSRIRGDFAALVGGAENDTGREMGVDAVSVSARRQSVPREAGVVVHRFDWDGFAVANDTHVVAGDAIRGFYVGPGTRLVLRWPAEYRATTAVPSPDETGEREATWTGGRFAADEPRLVFTHESAVADGPPTGLLGVAGALVLVAGLGGTVLFVRRRDGAPGTATGADAGGADGGAASAGDGRDASAGDAAGPTDEAPPPELLSNEERVLRVLNENGGRVKQQAIAAECDWGESKTSKVVTDLHEDGTVERFRLGRENVVALPEEVPLEDASPGDEVDRAADADSAADANTTADQDSAADQRPAEDTE